jgi:predicted dehydrogenase
LPAAPRACCGAVRSRRATRTPEARIYGEKGGLEWAQEDPNYLWHTPLGEPKRLLTRNGAGAGRRRRVSRIPGGHPGRLSRRLRQHLQSEAAEAIIAHRDGKPAPEGVIFPGIEDGLAGVAFVAACVESSRRGGPLSGCPPVGSKPDATARVLRDGFEAHRYPSHSGSISHGRFLDFGA